MHKNLNFSGANAGKSYENRLPNNTVWIAAYSPNKQSCVVMDTS